MTSLSTTPQGAFHPAVAPVFSHPVTTGVLSANEMLPDQFFTPGHESHGSWTGERLLLLAVLQEAIHTYLRYCRSLAHRGQRLFAEVQAWFSSTEHHYLYSFVSICEHLDLDPDYLRRGVLQRAAGMMGQPTPRPPHTPAGPHREPTTAFRLCR